MKSTQPLIKQHRIICLLILIACCLRAQGQQKYAAENLGPLVNSYADELSPVISSDGRTLYFVRSHHRSNVGSQDVWYCEKVNGKWSPAIHPPEPLNHKNHSSQITNISTDGNRLLMRGAYVDGEYEGEGVSVITKNKKGEWREPNKLDIKNLNKYAELGNYSNFFLCPDGKTLLFAFSESENGENQELYFSRLLTTENERKAKSFKEIARLVNRFINSDVWSEPVKIRELSIREFDDFAPFMASDGVTLYFASNRPGTMGDADIWMTKRTDDSWLHWTAPVNMGPAVNTDKWDAYYTLDARGEEAYMVSAKGAQGGSDIVRIKLTPEMKPKPVVLVRGRVLNARTKMPFATEVAYENLLTGRNAGVAQSDPRTGEYRIVLPYGSSYAFGAVSDKLLSQSEYINLEKEGEYQEITRDLFVFPVEEGSSIRLNIFFPEKSGAPLAHSYSAMEWVAGMLGQNGKMKVEIGAFVHGNSEQEDLDLTNAMARSVTDYLHSLGVPAERAVPKGYGSAVPLAGPDDPDAREKNTRIEMKVLKN